MKQKNFFLTPILISISLTNIPARAQHQSSPRLSIDTHRGLFQAKWIDTLNSKPDGSIRLMRAYSSRSFHRGWLGQGWCTSWDLQLQGQASKATVQRCGEPQSTSVLLTPNGLWEWRAPDSGQSAVFDRLGRLVQLKEPDGPPLHFDHLPGDRRIRLRTGDRPLGEIQLTPNGRRIAAIRFFGGPQWKYNYDGESLIRVSLDGASTEVFRYDFLDNLEEVWQGSDRIAKIQYEESKDRPISAHWEDCLAQVKYFANGESEVRRICKGLPPIKVTYRADGRILKLQQIEGDPQ